MRLENGTTAADSGTRICIDQVKASSRNVEVVYAIWQSWSAFRARSLVEETVSILHFPAIPAALLLNERVAHQQFRSPQLGYRVKILQITMPDAEMVRGVRFTSEILHGAELWHFMAEKETLFEAKSEEGPVTLHLQSRR